MKYPEDFINKVICGDCLEVMKEMPDECVDLVLTDPPYAETRHFETIELSGIGEELYRIAKKDCFLVTDFFRPAIIKYLQLFAPFKYKDMLTMYASNSMAQCALGFDCFTPSLILQKAVFLRITEQL